MHYFKMYVPVPWIISVSGLFVPLHFRSREHKVHRENFLLPWNIRSRGAKSHRTFVPWNFCTPGTFASQTTFMPFNFRSVEISLPYFKKLWKAGKRCFHSRILTNVRCCLLERKRCHIGLYNNGLTNHCLELNGIIK